MTAESTERPYCHLWDSGNREHLFYFEWWALWSGKLFGTMKLHYHESECILTILVGRRCDILVTGSNDWSHTWSNVKRQISWNTFLFSEERACAWGGWVWWGVQRRVDHPNNYHDSGSKVTQVLSLRRREVETPPRGSHHGTIQSPPHCQTVWSCHTVRSGMTSFCSLLSETWQVQLSSKPEIEMSFLVWLYRWWLCRSF